MLRDGYNVQFEGTIVRTAQEPTLLRENNIQRDQGWSWIVLFAAFLTLFITNGMHASFGILYAALISHFGSGREETAWIGSISLGLLCFFSPVASVLIEQIGCRATSIIGAFLCSLGFLITSFATGIALLYFSHGLLFGLGTSLTYTAAMTVVGRSFERRRNIATGLCTSGSQFGGISLAPLSQVLFDRLGFANTFRIFAGLLLVVAISSLVYRSELSGNTSRPTSAKKSPKEMLNVWKSKAYIVWALGTTMVTLGYNIPRYTLAKYASDQGISKDASAWLVSYLCASSAIGRITFGRLCEWVPKLYLCQACIIGCAFSAFLYPFLKSYLALVITAIIFGLPDGGFVASLSMVTTEIVGPEKMVEGFGFMLFCQSYSNVIGPPLSGMLYDTYKSYKAAFCFAAVPEIIGFLMLFLIPYYRRNQVKYTHEIEYGSNSGIMMNGNGAASTLNPISDTPILPAVEQQGEYNVVINLTSDNPDIRLVNVVIHKAGGSDTPGVTCTDGEADDQILDGGIVNKAVEEIEVPVCAGEMPVCTSALVTESAVEQPSPEAGASSIVVEPEAIMLSALSPMKSSSTQTVIHDSSAETKYANTSTVNDDRILPTALASSASRENVSQVIDVEISAPVQNFPSTQLVAIISNESQTDPSTGVISLGLQIKTSNKSLPLEASASVIQITSNTVPLSNGHENPVEEIIHLQTEQDVPKISPPPSHKHHVNNMKAGVHHVTNADVSSGCHDSVVDNSPEAMLAELDTLVQGSELPPKPCLTSPFTPDVNIQEASLMKCTGLEPGLAGFTPEPGLNQNQESLMLSTTFIPEMTSPCLSTAFSTEPPHMSGINDVLTQKQLPEPLKPTSLSSVRGNDQQGSQSQDMPPATSPLSCELSTVIADVIQSLTSQQSQKSNKESTISNMADNSQCTSEPIDHAEKKPTTLVENSTMKEPPKLGINVECSSQPSSELSSYCKLQTSLLHSMQSIVAEGCPEDVALLEDISIDLTLEKDPSFASIVVIDDIDEQNNTTDLNFPCLSNEPAVSQTSRVSELPHFANGLAHEPSMMTSTAVTNQPSPGATSTFSCQEQGFLGVTYEPSTNTPTLTQEQHFASRISSGLEHEAVIITSNAVSSQVLQEPTSIHPSVIQTQVFPCVDHAPNIIHTGVNSSMISGQVQPFSPDLPHETNTMLSTVVLSQLPREPSNTLLSANQQQPSGISSPEQNIEQYFTSSLAYEPASSVVSSQLQHEPINTQSSVNQQEASGISSPEQHIEQFFTSSLAYDPASSVVSSQLPHEFTSTQPSVIPAQERHFLTATREATLPSSQEQRFTALMHKPDIIPSCGISNQHEPLQVLTNTHPSVILVQELQFPNVTQECTNAHPTVSPTQKQPFPSVAMEASITQPSAISNEEQNVPSLTQELTIVLPSGTAEMVLQDTIVLELFPQTAGHDSTGYDATMSHEKLAKPIESTNPFYQDINQ